MCIYFGGVALEGTLKKQAGFCLDFKKGYFPPKLLAIPLIQAQKKKKPSQHFTVFQYNVYQYNWRHLSKQCFSLLPCDSLGYQMILIIELN